MGDDAVIRFLQRKNDRLGVPIPYCIWARNGREYPDTVEKLDDYLYTEFDPDLTSVSEEELDVARDIAMRMQPALNVWWVVRKSVERRDPIAERYGDERN